MELNGHKLAAEGEGYAPGNRREATGTKNGIRERVQEKLLENSLPKRREMAEIEITNSNVLWYLTLERQ